MTTYRDEERRIEEDEHLDVVRQVRQAKTEDEHLDALREAGSLGTGLSIVAQYGGHSGEDFSAMKPSYLIERIHELASASAWYAEHGPLWCVQFCEDKKAAAERELASRAKETP